MSVYLLEDASVEMPIKLILRRQPGWELWMTILDRGTVEVGPLGVGTDTYVVWSSRTRATRAKACCGLIRPIVD